LFKFFNVDPFELMFVTPISIGSLAFLGDGILRPSEDQDEPPVRVLLPDQQHLLAIL
jgi:hypothetical protein